jgi:hypothetical protein
MDTFQGSNEDPLSLHKYVYCSDNPINKVDPSGLKDYALKLIYAGNSSDHWDPLIYGGAFMRAASAAENLLTGNQIIVSSIQLNDNIYDRTRAAVEPKHLVPGNDRITTIVIAGHGAPSDIGCPVSSRTADLTWGDLGPLTSANTPQKRFAAYLKPYTQGHCTVYLDACNQADGTAGKDFMQVLAISLGAKVVGFEDIYFFTGFGDQWTATPTGISRSGAGFISSYQHFNDAMSADYIPF